MNDSASRNRALSIVAVAIAGLVAIVYVASTLLAASGEPRPTLMFFRIDTCEFCKAMAPIVDDIARQYRSELEVETLNVETAAGVEAAEERGVVGTPTVLLLDSDGIEVGRYQGVVPQSSLEQAVEQLLGE